MKDILNITYKCGHTGRVPFQGSASELRRRVWALEHSMCDECIQKERDEKNAAAARANAEAGLPALVGTEKQIAWAETIRNGCLEFVNNMADALDLEDEDDALRAMAIEQVKPQFFAQPSAAWWIENRGWMCESAFKKMLSAARARMESGEIVEKPSEELFCKDALQDAEGTVKITVEKNNVKAIMEKNDHFRMIVKRLGYAWRGGAWTRTMDAGCNSPADVAAQTTNELVWAGFAVSLMDEDTKKLLHTESWVPLNPRLIHYSGVFHNFEIIPEPDPDPDMMKEALAIPRAVRLRDGRIIVPPTSIDPLVDFADGYQFVMSQAATKEMERRQSAKRTKLMPVTKKPDLPRGGAEALRRNEDLSDLNDNIDEQPKCLITWIEAFKALRIEIDHRALSWETEFSITEEANKIPGSSRIAKPYFDFEDPPRYTCYDVPVSSARELMEFAERLGFVFTEDAKKHLMPHSEVTHDTSAD